MSGFKDEVPMPLAESRNGRAIPEFLIRNDNDDDSADDMFGVYSKTKKQQQPQNDYDNDDFFFGANLDFGDPSISSYSDSANGNNNSESEQHSFVDKTNGPRSRGNPRPNMGHRYNTRQHAQEDNDNDGDEEQENGGIVDAMDKKTKFEATIDYVGKDLYLSKLISGEALKTTDRQKKLIEDFTNFGIGDGSLTDELNNPDVDEEENARRRYRQMISHKDRSGNPANAAQNDVDFEGLDMDCGDDDYGEGNAQDIKQNALMHLNCKLCQHTSIQADAMDKDFYDAYTAVQELDFEKTCYAHDAQIFKEMAVVFNAHQKYIKDNGGSNYFFLTPDEMRNHFMWHDTSNPLRHLNMELKELKEIRKNGRQHLFGRAKNGRKFWNESKTKLFLSVLKAEQGLINNIALLRHQMNMNPRGAQEWKGGRGSGKGKMITGGGNLVSRHLNGAAKQGRYNNEYSK